MRAASKRTLGRRQILNSAVIAGTTVTGVVASQLGFNIRTAKAAGTTWRIQTSWPSGIGLQTFNDWCNSIIEKTGGELNFKAFGANDIAGDFQLFDAVKKGIIEGVNPFTLYWASRIPAAVFLTSYPLGLRTTGEWDVFYNGLGGLEIARELFAQQGLFFVGHIHHGANILHSKSPIRSIEDFRGRKMRVPGGLVADVFRAAGAKTIALPSSKIFPALESGAIDIADYVGPAINYELGLHKVTKYISMGPPGQMSIYQPADLMDLTVDLKHWHALPRHMRRFLDDEIAWYSRHHYAAIQRADQEVWPKFERAGTVINRLSSGDVEDFTRLAIPYWFARAEKDEGAGKVLNKQLSYMMSGSLGYVSRSMVKGQRKTLNGGTPQQRTSTGSGSDKCTKNNCKVYCLLYPDCEIKW